MKVISVNIGTVQLRPVGAQRVSTAIGKRPVDGPVAVGPLGLEGDEQADQSVHGGLSKAVYAYPAAHYAFWQTVRAQARVAPWAEPLPAGTLGENLTIEGLDERRLWVQLGYSSLFHYLHRELGMSKGAAHRPLAPA